MLDAGLGLGLFQLGLQRLGGDLRGDVDDEQVLVGGQRGALREVEVLGEDLGADLGALDRDLDVLGDVGGLGLDLDRGVLGDDQGVGGGVADDVDRDVDGDLLAADDGDEVDVLDLTRRIGSTWTCLVSARCSVPSKSRASSALAPPCLSAIIVSWPGRVTCSGSAPWP